MKVYAHDIEPIHLAVALIPVGVVVVIFALWSLNGKTVVYATARMLIQLIAVGYVLTFIFALETPGIVLSMLAVMLLIAGWIALRPIKCRSPRLFLEALGAICIGGVSTLALTILAVFKVDYWYQPQYVVPIAGMIFSNAMNTVSLAAERFESDLATVADYVKARNHALNAALIPSINTFFAVGLVAFPGMMTGQILAGVSPLVAAKYQIVIMSVLFGSSGISAAVYLWLQGYAIRHCE